MEADETTTTHRVLFDFIYMKSVFHHLELADKNSFSKVCMQWNQFAHSYSLNETTYYCDYYFKWLGKNGLLHDLRNRPLLKRLSLNRNDYSQADFDDILRCILTYIEDLRELKLFYPQPDTLSALTEKFKNIVILELILDTSTVEECLQRLSHCVYLTQIIIKVYKCDVGYEGDFVNVMSTGFRGLTSLELNIRDNLSNVVYIPHCHFEKSLENLSKNLKFLCIDLADQFPSSLSLCVNLQALYCGISNISKSFDFSSLPNLKTLSLRFLGGFDKEILQRTFEDSLLNGGLRIVKKLNVTIEDKCYDIGLLRNVIKHSGCLEELKLNGVDKSTIHDQVKDIDCMYNLRTLSLCGAISIDNFSIQYISKLKNLEDLTIRPCLLTDSGILKLSDCPAVIAIRVSGCKLTAEGVISLFANARKLRYLTVTDCGINSSAVNNIKRVIGPTKHIMI